MARRKRLSDSEIQSLCDQQITTAAGWYSGELADERAEALDMYLGEPLGDEVAGRSQIRTREVLDTVESVLPSLIRIFADAENICEFDPVGPEDEEAAAQESDLVNNVFWKSGPSERAPSGYKRGFHNLYSFIKDGLLSKVGVLKVWWDSNPRREREEYQGLNDWELSALVSDPNTKVDVLEYEQDDVTGLHNIVIMATREEGRICIEPCPPEEFGVDRDARSIYPGDLTFVYHRTRKTKAELIEMGFDRKLVETLPTSDDVETEERLARRHLDDEQEFYRSGEHWSMHRVWVSECYLNVDRDGDGLSELLKVTLSGAESGYSSGSTLLDIEEIDRMPFVTWSPVLLTHKFYGLSLADLVMDIQAIKTTIVRRMLDSTYLATDGRTAINERVNIDDILTSRPGGVVRTEGTDPPQNNLFPIPQQPVPPQTFDMMEYLDDMRQKRTGVGEEVGALDTNALANVNTGVAALAYDAARARIELMARLCAEIGLQPLFLRIHELLRKHNHKPMAQRVRGRWIELMPQHWREREDMTVKVGIGRVSRERRLVALSDTIEKQATAAQGGGMGLLLRPEHMQRAINDYTRELGLEESLYWSAPGEMPPPEPEPPDYQMAQIQVQGALVEAQMQKNSVDAAKVASEERIKAAEIAAKQQELELRARVEALKAQSVALRSQLEHADKNGRTALEAEIAAREQERKDAELAMKTCQDAARREVDMYRALIQSGTQITTERMKIAGLEGGDYLEEVVRQATETLTAKMEEMAETHKNEIAVSRQQMESTQREMESIRREAGERAARIVELERPTEFERDDDGFVISVGGRPVNRDERGLIISIG